MRPTLHPHKTSTWHYRNKTASKIRIIPNVTKKKPENYVSGFGSMVSVRCILSKVAASWCHVLTIFDRSRSSSFTRINHSNRHNTLERLNHLIPWVTASSLSSNSLSILTETVLSFSIKLLIKSSRCKDSHFMTNFQTLFMNCNTSCSVAQLKAKSLPREVVIHKKICFLLHTRVDPGYLIEDKKIPASYHNQQGSLIYNR